MKKTNPNGVPIGETSDEEISVDDSWQLRQFSKINTRVSVVENEHLGLRRDLADVRQAVGDQVRSLAKIELGLVAIQSSAAHMAIDLARITARADSGGKNSVDWVRWIVQVVLTIVAVCVAVYAASRK